VTATDADLGDNARILYMLPGNQDGKFTINANTGEVFLAEKLDYEDR